MTTEKVVNGWYALSLSDEVMMFHFVAFAQASFTSNFYSSLGWAALVLLLNPS